MSVRFFESDFVFVAAVCDRRKPSTIKAPAVTDRRKFSGGVA